MIADSLNFGQNQVRRDEWLKRVRKLLLELGGHGRVMRSVAKMVKLQGVKSTRAEDFAKAINYLKNRKRYMSYFEMKAQNFPIGSGVVESACKQIVSERI